MASQLAEHAAIYSAYVVLGSIPYCLLLYYEVMVDPRLKQHPEVIFLSETLLSQSKSIYRYSMKS
jgi:hypothetical protein